MWPAMDRLFLVVPRLRRKKSKVRVGSGVKNYPNVSRPYPSVRLKEAY